MESPSTRASSVEWLTAMVSALGFWGNKGCGIRVRVCEVVSVHVQLLSVSLLRIFTVLF